MSLVAAENQLAQLGSVLLFTRRIYPLLYELLLFALTSWKLFISALRVMIHRAEKRMLSCPALRVILLRNDWASPGLREDVGTLTSTLLV